jgi:integrase
MVFKRGHSWVAQWTEDGRRRTKSCSARDLAERVEEHAKGRELLIQMGLTSRRGAEQAALANTSTDKVCELYCQTIRGSEAHRACVRSAAKEVLAGAGCIGEVRGPMVTAWLERRRPGWSPRTYNHYLRAARAVTAWAANQNYIEADPLRGLRRMLDPAMTRERRSLTVAEFERLRPWSRFADCLTCVFSGLRWSEARAIKMSDLDLKQRLLTVRKGVGKKDREIRSVLPLASILVEPLSRRQAIGGAPVIGSPPRPRVWRAAMKRFGVALKTDRGLAVAASLRPTFCTWLAQAGVPLDTIMRLRRDRGPLAEAVYVDRSQLLDQLRAGLERMVRWHASQARCTGAAPKSPG